MYILPRTLVNPRSINLRFETRFLYGDQVYAMIEGKKQWISYDVRLDTVSLTDFTHVMQMVNNHYAYSTMNSGDSLTVQPSAPITSGRQSVMLKLQLNKASVDEDLLRQLALTLPHPSFSGMRFLVALINHRVKGDELIKGLRAIGVDLGLKLVDSYLGGWIIGPDSQEVLTIEQLIQRIDEQLDE